MNLFWAVGVYGDMKSLTLSLASLALFAGTAMAIDTRAQVSVPFEFEVQGKRMPAGRYDVVPHPASNTVTLRSENGQGIAFFTVSAGSDARRQSTRMVFKPVSGMASLAEIWTGKDGAGYLVVLPSASTAADANRSAD